MAYDKKLFENAAFQGYEARGLKEFTVKWVEKSSGDVTTDLKRAQNNLKALMQGYLNPTGRFMANFNRNEHDKTIAKNLLEFLDENIAKLNLGFDDEAHLELLKKVKDTRDEILIDTKCKPDNELINRLDTFLMRELFIDSTKKADMALKSNETKPNESSHFSVDRQIDAGVSFKLLELKEKISDKDSLYTLSKKINKKSNKKQEAKDDQPRQSVAIQKDTDFVMVEQKQENDQKKELVSDKLHSVLGKFLHQTNNFTDMEISTRVNDLDESCKSETPDILLFTKAKELLDCAINGLEFKSGNKNTTMRLATELTDFFQKHFDIPHDFKSSRQIDAYVSFAIAVSEPSPTQTISLKNN